MDRTISTFVKVAALASGLGVFAAVSFVGAPAAHAQWTPPPPPPQGGQWAPPPPEYIATTEPVYYEGHAAYWYNNHWYWRDAGGNWGHYDQEPAFLADRRMHSPPDRREFERGRRR
jgi:hypothetical protein